MATSPPATSSVTQKGQVTLPAEMRAALGLKTGSKVIFKRHGKRLVLELFQETPVESIFGTLRVRKGQGIRDVDAALDKLRMQRWNESTSRVKREPRRR